MTNISHTTELKDLPYEGNRRFVCVEFPGIVNNDDRALTTLGGVDKINKTYGDPTKRLELQWRPADIYSKPMFGDRTNTSRLLLKVKHRWKKDDPSQQEITGRILGPILTTYKYDAMGDFQYLPMQHSANNTFTSLTDGLFITEPIKIDEFLSRDMPMFLPPSSFSRFDKASDYAFRPEVQHRPQYDDPAHTRPKHLIGTCRQRRPNFGHFLSFNIEVLPTCPHEAAVARMIKFTDEDTIKRIRQLFEERPLWTRPAISAVGSLSHVTAKIILPVVAIYWQTGPWRKCWCRFGYDPRALPEAKKYQAIDFRLRQREHAGEKLKILSKRSSMNQVVPYSAKVNKPMTTNVKAAEFAALSVQESSRAAKEMDTSVYIFRPDHCPPYRQVYYQVCDIQVDSVQHLVSRNDNQETTCDHQDGWFLKGTTAACRLIMNSCVEKLISRLARGSTPTEESMEVDNDGGNDGKTDDRDDSDGKEGEGDYSDENVDDNVKSEEYKQ